MTGVVINDHEKYEGHVLEDSYISSALSALLDEPEKCVEEMISSASMWNMDGMAVMGICEDAYQKLLCHRTRDFLDRCWI